jgi:hypothetical protein
MKIIVTREHISRGERKSRSSCPVALAIHEQLGTHSQGVIVDVHNIFVTTKKNKVFVFDAPVEVKSFSMKYDVGEAPYVAFEFSLPVDQHPDFW